MQSSSNFVHRVPAAGFPPGRTVIVSEGAGIRVGDEAGMEFSVQRLSPGETFAGTDVAECAWVLLRGVATGKLGAETFAVRRDDIFSESPSTLHLGPRTPLTVVAGPEGAEFAVVRSGNSQDFSPRVFLPTEVKPEYRGAGLVQNTCLRNVRLIFDRATRPQSNLVVGEVINYPGRWSSYPPHHHAQPEIYHYRFTHPQGYGHGELGEEVLKIRNGDTLSIAPGLDHAQVAAPGYGMYYLWMIRHLPGNPYTGFTFAEEHKWALDGAQQGWIPPTASPLAT